MHMDVRRGEVRYGGCGAVVKEESGVEQAGEERRAKGKRQNTMHPATSSSCSIEKVWEWQSNGSECKLVGKGGGRGGDIGIMVELS